MFSARVQLISRLPKASENFELRNAVPSSSLAHFIPFHPISTVPCCALSVPFASLASLRFPSLPFGALSLPFDSLRFTAAPFRLSDGLHCRILPSPPWAATEWRQQRASPQPPFAVVVASARWLPVSAPQRASPQPPVAVAVDCARCCFVAELQRGPPLPPSAVVVASAQCWSVPAAERALHPWAPSASLWRRGLPLPPSAVAVACTRCCVDAELKHGPPLPPSAGVVARARCWSVPEAERALRPWAPSASPWRLKCRRWHHAVAAPIPTVIVR